MKKSHPQILEKERHAPGSSSHAVVIAYVPALHEGYRQWWNELPQEVSTCYLLDESLLSALPRAERDVSRIPATVMAPAIAALNRFALVTVLTKDSLAALATVPPTEIFSHRHVVTEHVLDAHFANIPTHFTNIFLRWDMGHAKAATAVDPDIQISRATFQQKVLNDLNITASQSKDWWRQVAALVMKDGKLLLPAVQNKHLPFEDIVNWEGDPRSWLDAGESPEISTALHCEQALIAAAARDGTSLKGADLYVTTFPCPVCAKLIAATGFARCFFSEGYSQTGGARILKAAGVQLIRVEQ